MTDQLHTHPGTLCESGSRAVDLALELGRARMRIAELEAAQTRAGLEALPLADCDALVAAVLQFMVARGYVITHPAAA